MAARTRRNAEVNDDDTDEIAYDHPGLNAWRKSGDFSVLSDPSFSEWEWTVYRLHTPEETTRLRPATPRLWVTKLAGPLDVLQIQANYGGGTFEFWGKYDGDLRTRIKLDISGPRKDFNAAPATAAPAAAAAPASTADPTLLRILEGQQRQLDQLTAASRLPAAPPLGIKDVFEMVNLMRGQGQAESPVAEVMTAFKEGIEMGKLAGGEPQRDKLEIIMDRVVPMVERVGGQIIARAAENRRATATAPAPKSHATVVETPTPAAAAPDAAVFDGPPGSHRMRTAVEVLANAIAEGDDPLDTADVLERVLTPQEVGLLKLLDDASVIAQLRERAGGQFAVLLTPEADAYTVAVMAALRQPPGEGAGV